MVAGWLSHRRLTLTRRRLPRLVSSVATRLLLTRSSANHAVYAIILILNRKCPS
jgi:hypothetical protein